MGEDDPENRSNPGIDPEVTYPFPAGELPGSDGNAGPADADSWVAQWSGQFDDPAKPPRDDADAATIASWQKAQERARRRAKLRANQRTAESVTRFRPQPDEIQSAVPFSIRFGENRRAGRRLVAVAAMAMVGALAAVGYVMIMSDSSESPNDGAAIGIGDTNADEFGVRANLNPRGIQELARSTVQLVGLNDDGQPECAGSGVIVESDGTILTNAHVITRSELCRFRTIGVATAADSTSPAQLRYEAKVLAVDENLDLAVLRIVGPLNEGDGSELPPSFPEAPIGDSNSVNLGDGIRVLGFPVIGGDTITLTTGSVSGFTSQEGVGPRALIKTDASISSGNSGGMAIDGNGRVVGIPTKARASETGPAIDCRPLSDTNEDGLVDENDNCVPVGGFLNGIRPINLARPLLIQAESASPIPPPSATPGPGLDFDPKSLAFTNPRFSLGKDGNIPREEIVTASAGIPELCFFVDWSGIPSGLNLIGAWFIDGVAEPAFDGDDQGPWELADQGRNFWLCAEETTNGLPAGIYEIGFFVDDQLIFAEGIELTEEPADVVEITWVNELEVELCGLAINPKGSGAGLVGLNELDSGVVIPPDGSVTMSLPVGFVVVEAYDCDGEPVADEFDGLPIEKTDIFSIRL